MEIFSEIYNCYYSVVSSILKNSPLTKKQIDKIVSSKGFSDSMLFLTPELCEDNQWNLLTYQPKDNTYTSILENPPIEPITLLEKSWIKSLILDDKFKLFLDEDLISNINETLKDVPPLFEKDNFYYFDQFSNGDDFKNPKYKSNFLTILKAIKDKQVLLIDYNSSKNNSFSGYFQPLRLEYSLKNDKFRLFSAKISKNNKYKYYILNLSGIENIKISDVSWLDNITITDFFTVRNCKEPITVKVLKERNGIERFMMEFACYEKHTEYDSNSEIVIAKIWYDKQNETELLIRLLSFGPVLEILSPQDIRDEAKERIISQYNYFFNKD